MPGRALLRSLLLLGVLVSSGLLAVSGCGSDTATFVPKAGYTPETLAEEFAFRYDRMNPVSRPKPVTSPRNRESAETAEKVATKSGEKTKAQQAVTLEDLVDEIVAKSGEVPGMTPEEVLRKVAERVEKNPKIKEADRRLIADRLVRSK